MSVTVVVGGFYGDEGKGKMISYLAAADDPDIVARGGAGPNAGHTIRRGDRTYKIRMLPSGFLNPRSQVLVGPGVVVNPALLLREIEEFGAGDRAFVDRNCGIIEQSHMDADSGSHLGKKIGSTGSGTGPANAARAMRTLRLARDVESLSHITADVPGRIHQAIRSGGNVLIEGTQGTFLSLWHGTYPYVTSKDVTASAICADVGVGPTAVDSVVLVLKSFVTRVGTGPLAGELPDGETARRGWSERGTVTGRPRRAAPMDYDLVRRAVMLNGATQIALTKLDVVFPECSGATSYGDLPGAAVSFVEELERNAGVSVSLIGTGPEESAVIDRRGGA